MAVVCKHYICVGVDLAPRFALTCTSYTAHFHLMVLDLFLTASDWALVFIWRSVLDYVKRQKGIIIQD